jgi:hypothetical protein
MMTAIFFVALFVVACIAAKAAGMFIAWVLGPPRLSKDQITKLEGFVNGARIPAVGGRVLDIKVLESSGDNVLVEVEYEFAVS